MGRELPIKPKQGMEICFDLNLYFVQQVWTNIEGNRANLVQTAWALLSLIDAGQVCPSFSPKLFNKLYINMIDLGFSNS